MQNGPNHKRPPQDCAVVPLDAAAVPLWDALTAQHPDATIYHDRRWLVPICEATGDALRIYGFFWRDRLIGGIPMQVRTKGPAAFARRAFATPYCNPLFIADTPPEIKRALLEELTNRHLCTVVAASPFAPEIPLGPRWTRRERATYMLDIADPDALWNNVPYPLRKKIRKARRHGLVFQKGCPPETFHALYQKTFARRRRTLPLGEDALRRLLPRLEDAAIARSYLVSTAEGRPCAAGMVLMDSRRAYYALAGTDIAATPLPASALLLWEIIRDLAPDHAEFDLVGANLSGVNRFKKQFAGRLAPYAEHTAFRTPIEKAAFRLYQALNPKG